jgi:PS-10 peptidase S37
VRRLVLVAVLIAGFVRPFPALADDLPGRLAAIPGMRVVTHQGNSLVLGYRQPVDHHDPGGKTFEQRITLRYRAPDRPTVLYTTGYELPLIDIPVEPTLLVDGNQVTVEERFFPPSRPEPPDWSKLDIWQAATDHHRVVTALRPLLPGAWLSTGVSKGGMATVYHRRFYPGDVDGTIAYVAPDDAVDDQDAYVTFLDHVGDQTCRDALADVQRRALSRRADLVNQLQTWAAQRSYTYSRVFGSADKSLELLVVETPFIFWQFYRPNECATVPTATASSTDLFDFLDRTTGFANYTDQGVQQYLPYYYQAGTQLGYPAFREDHLAGLLRFPHQAAPRSYVPPEIPMRYQPGVIADVDNWVRTDGDRLMFVYGEVDPWGAEPFRLGPGSRDSFWYLVPGGNHDSEIANLPDSQRTAATATVRRWAATPALRCSPLPTGRDRC